MGGLGVVLLCQFMRSSGGGVRGLWCGGGGEEGGGVGVGWGGGWEVGGGRGGGGGGGWGGGAEVEGLMWRG